MFSLISSQESSKSFNLKQSIKALIAGSQDEFGYGTISKVIPGWNLELFFTPHSNQPIAFTATNDNKGVYEFELDLGKLNQGWVVINGSNDTAKSFLIDWFNELVA